jgi:hypothetical protein
LLQYFLRLMAACIHYQQRIWAAEMQPMQAEAVRDMTLLKAVFTSRQAQSGLQVLLYCTLNGKLFQ